MRYLLWRKGQRKRKAKEEKRREGWRKKKAYEEES